MSDAMVAEIMAPSALASMGSVATRLALPSHGVMVAVRKLRNMATGISHRMSNSVRSVTGQNTKSGILGKHTHCHHGQEG